MASKDYYSETNLSDIRAKYNIIENKTNDLLLKYVANPFISVKAKEYAHHGFARRIQTLPRKTGSRSTKMEAT